jgi:hypothetical protein
MSNPGLILVPWRCVHAQCVHTFTFFQSRRYNQAAEGLVEAKRRQRPRPPLETMTTYWRSLVAVHGWTVLRSKCRMGILWVDELYCQGTLILIQSPPPPPSSPGAGDLPPSEVGPSLRWQPGWILYYRYVYNLENTILFHRQYMTLNMGIYMDKNIYKNIHVHIPVHVHKRKVGNKKTWT